MRGARAGSAAVLTLLALAIDVSAQPARAPLPRLIVDETLDGPSTAAEAADRIGTTAGIVFGARVRMSTISRDGQSALAPRLSLLDARRIPVWLAVPAPAALGDSGAWRAALTTILSEHGARLVVLEVDVTGASAELRRFALEVAATEARARYPGILVAAGADGAAETEALTRDASAALAPYVDIIVTDDGAAGARGEQVAAAPLRVVRAGALGTTAAEARLRAVGRVLGAIGTQEAAGIWTATPDRLVDALRALAPIAPLLTHEVTELDSTAVSLRVSRSGGAQVPTPRVLFDHETFTSYLAYDGGPAGTMHVELRLPVEAVPMVYDLASGTREAAADYRRDPSSGLAQATVPVTGRPMLVDFNDGAADVVGDRAGVAARRMLTVDEIVARHRQQQAAQDALLRHYTAHARLEQHFRPSLTDPGYDVVTENRYFVEGGLVEWEELSFSVNGSKWGSDRPPFPLLQPEKVLSQPLDLRLGRDYEYRLAGTERVDDVDTYVVRFEPSRDDRSLYRGTVWIDQRTFAKIRVQAVQTQTSAPIVSNEETHTYTAIDLPQGGTVRLLTRLDARQIILIAGRNLLLEKATTLSDIRVNGAGFAEARAAARSGDRIMYRDTDRGVRYLVKEGDTRVVSERLTTRARAMAMGVLVDPSYAFPLPIFGINYLEFEFLGKPDTQLALLFGGVLAAGNIQRPKLGSTPFDASLDFFGIAVPSTDRVYGGGGERDDERVLTWPLTTGLNVGWQYTPFQKIQGRYHLRFDGYHRDTTTAEEFVVPSSTVTNGTGASWEYRRGGYSLIAEGTYFRRASWKAWGVDGSAPPEPGYTKYAAHLSKDVFLDSFRKIHLNVSYFGGRHLDRFSRYQFGLFDDTRLHGVPSSGIRFDEVAMIRGAYSFDVFGQYRFDAFLDGAWGRDMSIDRDWQPITGIGVALNMRAPWNTILRADLGKSFLPDRYEGVGSTVVQVMLLKPLR